MVSDIYEEIIEKLRQMGFMFQQNEQFTNFKRELEGKVYFLKQMVC